MHWIVPSLALLSDTPRRVGVRHIAASLLAVATWCIAAPVAAHTIATFAIPTAASGPSSAALGADGNIWFNEYNGSKVAKITPAGVITEYTSPAPGNIGNVALGPDGNIWFGIYSAPHQIGFVTPTGTFTIYPLPAGASPGGMTSGPDGNLWVADSGNNGILKITPAGAVTSYGPLPTANSLPVQITSGPDGNLWFTELNTGKIGRITPAGVITEFAIPGGASSWPRGITVGPDGNLWITEDQGNNITVMNTSGTVLNRYPLPTGTPYTTPNRPMDIVSGPDGKLWFTESSNNAYASITLAGLVSEYVLPTSGTTPIGIALGADNRLWLTLNGTNTIAAVGPASSTALASSVNPAALGQTITFSAQVTGASPTGTVDFFDNDTTLLGTATVDGSGMASLSTSALTAGSHAIKAVYSGTGALLGSTSMALTQVVSSALTASSTVVTAPASTITVGDAITLTITVTGAAPTGTVTLYDGASAMGSAALTGGIASITFGSLGVGTHTITAAYAGDANNAASTSPVFVVTVNAQAQPSGPVQPVPAGSWLTWCLMSLLLAALGIQRRLRG